MYFFFFKVNLINITLILCIFSSNNNNAITVSLGKTKIRNRLWKYEINDFPLVEENRVFFN